MEGLKLYFAILILFNVFFGYFVDHSVASFPDVLCEQEHDVVVSGEIVFFESGHLSYIQGNLTSRDFRKFVVQYPQLAFQNDW